ncbi:MAG: NAD(P)H-hydrate dehydratase [Rickettsiales bacterium]
MGNRNALFTADEARAADAATIKAGTPSEQLMQNAAGACVELICKLYLPRPIVIVCGHGNNGGDGKLIGEPLKERGWPVTMTDTQGFTPSILKDKALVVDALFGTGLNRPIEGTAKSIIEDINKSGLPVISVDIASGINATTGEIMGAAIYATHSITFVRAKLGQVLLPGKAYSGQLHIVDIGIDPNAVPQAHQYNTPALWKPHLPLLTMATHKYVRGHALVMGGGIATTGAARLAANACLRAGAGLVSIACDDESLPIYAASLMAVMTKPTNSKDELETLLEDKRISAVVIGPGYGIGGKTHDAVLQILSHKKACVIDADAISSFKGDSNKLFEAIQSPTVLTPHEGEFERLFNVTGSKPERASQAAKLSGAVVILKGSDTVIAAPDGRIAIDGNAPVWLGTAGSGDVLAGIVGGLLAQGMPAFEAACASAWIHGKAATQFGPGMTSEDLLPMMPQIFRGLYS